ncbi:MAG: sulfatase-like hydrolase/transferase [Cyclobacteriaceae bacterium]
MEKKYFFRTVLVIIYYAVFTGILTVAAIAQELPTYDSSVPKPTLSGISYGEHQRHILDFWKAESNSSTPLVFVIHGGGWKGGEKERVHRFANVQQLLDAGISVVAINYRLMKHVNAEEIAPPVKAPMYDAARALQFVRSKADEWNIDKERIGAAGGSAGACTSLWLAYHKDLAKPNSKDPIARESSRLWCAAVMGPQTTLDPQQMKKWTPNSKYGGHAFGKVDFEQFLAERESILPWIAEYSPYALASADDPPVYLLYNVPPALGQNQKDPTHTANFGVKLQERCEQVGIGCELKYPDAPVVKHETPTDYLIASLKGSARSSLMKDSQKRPNILFIAIDDLRPELGSYGAKHIKSPNIDKLARQGVQFNKAYCQAPHCLPSRASMLTGIHLSKSTLLIDIEQFASGVPTLPGTFRKAGYYTLCNGKIFHQNEDMAEQSWSEPPFSLVNGKKENNHLTFHDKESGKYILEKNKRGPFFEAPDVPDNTYIDGQNCEKTIKDMQRLAKMGKPFFLACGFVRPHLPFYAPKKYWDMYDREAIALAENRYKPKNAPGALRSSGEFGSYHDRNIEYNSTEFHKIARHGYYASVSYVDALIGKLLSMLEELGLSDNTIVVVWGDHGWNLGEHNYWSKHNLLHNSKNAPLIISAPGFDQNIKTDGIVELVDIYPTLCDLAGIKLPEHLEGESIVPLMQNPKKEGKEAAYTFWGNGASVTTLDYSYTEYDNNERMLFNLRKDPEENVNVVEVAENTKIVKQLSEVIAKRYKMEKQE